MIDPGYKLVFDSGKYRLYKKNGHFQIFSRSHDKLDNPYFIQIYCDSATGLIQDLLAALEANNET